MSGKKNKRNKRLERERAREEARRQQRRQTTFTLIVLAVIVAIGGALIWVSLEREPDPLAEQPTEEPTAEATEDFTEDFTEDPVDEREVACGAEAPPAADEDKPLFDEPEDVVEGGVSYSAVIETSCGTVVMDLDAEGAPRTVNSFVFLAQQGFFDGLEIFRNATSIGALQTGSGVNDAAYSVGYTIPDELEVAEEEGYPAGSVAMANAGPDTAGSQFFFVYNTNFDEAFADNRAYSRFAMVVEGLDVLNEIGAIPADGETPTQVVYMNSVTILADGEPLPRPEPAAPATEPPAEATEEATEGS